MAGDALAGNLVLASGSPRRAELLRQLGLEFHIVRPDIDETPDALEAARAYVARMSASKLEAAFGLIDAGQHPVVLCADTIVVLDRQILGKPADRSEGLEMLHRLSGRDHQVLTSVSLGQRNGKIEQFVVETNVRFRTLTSEECENYWATGEPSDKAGGYGAQGLGSIFVEGIEGSYTNVVGLPLMETSQALARYGIGILSKGRKP